MAQFKVGDVVKLKSGGPVMTVEVIDWAPVGMVMAGSGRVTSAPKPTNTGMVRCTWFNSKGELKKAEFREDALEPAEP